MTKVYALNNQIATEPFPNKEIKIKNTGGFAMIEQKGSLTTLRVIAGDKEGTIPPGALVYVNSEHFKAAWALKIFHLPQEGMKVVHVDGKVETVNGEPIPFILVPRDAVQLVEIGNPYA